MIYWDTMKIIFLDIDGVLVTGDDPKSLKEFALVDGDRMRHFQPNCVKALNALTDQTGAKIIISSTWRNSHEFPILLKHFKNEGVTGEVIGITPTLREVGGYSVFRGLEIQHWLNKNDHTPIESFVILDDDSDMCHLMPRFVKCKFRDWDKTGAESGFTMKELPKAIEILNKPL